MAKITFYETKKIDEDQLTSFLQSTDHTWTFVDSVITMDNLDPETEVLSVFVNCVVTKEMIEALPKLRVIACRSTGFNNIDHRACRSRDITVLNVPAYGEQTVAEFAIALLLNLTRKVNQLDNDPTQPLMGIDLEGKTIGVLGTGRIGKKLIAIARGFSMRILAYDAFPDEVYAAHNDFTYDTLENVLAQSDFISLHMPALPSTIHILNSDRIALMKKGAYVINTARGDLIDTVALVKALNKGHIAGAGLDVLEGEKLLSLKNDVSLLDTIQDKPEEAQQSIALLALSHMDNVILTPHSAFDTIEAVGRINKVTAENIINYWYGQVPNKVTMEPEKGTLFIVRHTTSVWNGMGKWTGTRDVHLSEKGFNDASSIGKWFKGKRIDYAFCSQQMRSFETMRAILDVSGQPDVPYTRSDAINERDYGDYTGKNKWEMKDLLGEDIFNHLRRDWDFPVPNGETLKIVYERAVPYFISEILPRINNGENVLLAAHGNSLRAIMKYIEDISDEAIADLEMLFGSVVVYSLKDDGKMNTKELHEIVTDRPNA